MQNPETPTPSEVTPSPEAADPSWIAATILRLRAEHDASDSPALKAVLLHEIGLLEETSGDEASAARDHLQAVNAEAGFREPLERLISIIERRQSFKNLGKLLDRLVKVAERPDERARALLENAAYLTDHQEELDAARDSLEEAIELTPDDEALWLALELIGFAQDDRELTTRALAKRAELTQDLTWRGLLLMDLAELWRDQGDAERANQTLEAAIELQGPATFRALLALERLGGASERLDWVGRALDAQATLIHSGVSQAEAATALGVPTHRLTLSHAMDAWLRAAEAYRTLGDVGRASQVLTRATAQLPDDPHLLHARLLTAEASGQTEETAALAQRELELGVTGPLAASLWLKVAEAAAAKGDGPAALSAVNSALSHDVGSIPARVLQLDLLIGGADPPALAGALEATAAELPTDEAKARYFLAAADAWSRLARDSQGARAALSQAAMFGASPGLVARVARMLAAESGDAGWFIEATRRLLAAGATDSEQAGLWFELGRAKLLRGDRAGAEEAFTHLASAPGGSWLGPALSAFVLPLAEGAQSAEEGPRGEQGLTALLAVETAPEERRALALLAAVRARLAGDLANARDTLSELQADDPSDRLSGTALAAVLEGLGELEQAEGVLTALADQVDEPEDAAALWIEAGLIAWRRGARSAAVDALARSAELAPKAGGPLLVWALRAATPDDPQARRRALLASGQSAAVALERWGLEAGAESAPDVGRDALTEVELALEPSELASAVVLAQVVSGDEQATSELAQLGDGAERLVLAQRYLRALGDEGGPEQLEELARAWAADVSAPDAIDASVEWLTQAVASAQPERESAARAQLGALLPGEAGESLTTSARLVRLLSGHAPEALVQPRGVAARLTNLELALPGGGARRRARALSTLDTSLGEDSTALAQGLAGWNYLAAQDHAAAAACFRVVTEALPSEVLGWEGLRATAQASGDRELMAEACAALGDAVSDPATGAELWETSALILLDELGDADRGELALARTIERDIRRDVAFDRLFRIVRGRKDGATLLELIEQRLEVAEDPEEIVKLFWERARVLRKAGDLNAALAALENVTMLEPEHVGALALMGEIALSTRRFAEAAEYLGRLAELDEAPIKQRLMSGVAAADIYENKLDDIHQALAVLTTLYRAGLSTLPIRERLARAAGKAGAWEQATELLEKLMLEREAPEGRVEAARLAMAIHRDQRARPGDAAYAVEVLLGEAPEDGEALDLLLSGALPESLQVKLVPRARATLVSRATRDPLNTEVVNRLARVAEVLSEAPLRQATLGALTALGAGTRAIDAELMGLDLRVERTPQMAILAPSGGAQTFPELFDPEDTGPIVELLLELAPVLSEAIGPGLAAFGVGKRDRVDPRAGLPVRNELAAWAGALGVGDFDLYVGGQDAQGIFGLPLEKPTLVVGSQVSAPFSAAHRALAARELFALRRGTSLLRHRDPGDVAALVAAACRVVGVPVATPAYAMLAEFERQLAKALPRRLKKTLPQIATAFVNGNPEGIGWVQERWVNAANSTLDRMAAIAAGDVSQVTWLFEGTARGTPPQTQLGTSRLTRLLSFVLSPAYLDLRARLGMGVR